MSITALVLLWVIAATQPIVVVLLVMGLVRQAEQRRGSE